jgi:hypothetical protein
MSPAFDTKRQRAEIVGVEKYPTERDSDHNARVVTGAVGFYNKRLTTS